MIPYDSDMDISVLGSAEKKLRQLGTPRDQIKNGQFNLVLRIGSRCTTSRATRQDCYGRAVCAQTDICAFCGPVGRVFYEFGVYMDVFLLHLEIRFDDKQRPIAFGYLDEKRNRFGSDLDGLFPLKSCKFLGLDVPCPRDPATLLRPLYGKDFMKPPKRCNQVLRNWVESS
ncbi:unnamed protein product [Calicophoron daubneyi]